MTTMHKSKPMSKTELIGEIQKKLGKDATKAYAERALEAVLGATAVAIKKTGGLQLIGFGTYKVSERKARKGVNPQTGKPIQIKASKTISFKASSKLKSACGLM